VGSSRNGVPLKAQGSSENGPPAKGSSTISVSEWLDDKDFEHHDRIVSFTANLGGMKRTKDFLERFPIDEFIDARDDLF